MALSQQDKLPNYYATLGVIPQATLEEIKLAYRRLVRLYHPDSSGDKTTRQKFHQIQEAYEVLSSKEKRRLYDIRYGYTNRMSSKAYQQQESDYSASRDQNNREHRASEKKVNIPEEDLGDSLSQLFEPLLAWFQSQAHAPQTQDVKQNSAFHPVYLTQSEADSGVIKAVEIREVSGCDRCSETGRVNNRECVICKGKGVIHHQSKLDVRIPKNVRNGQLLRIPKKTKRHMQQSAGNLEFWVLKVHVAQIARTLKVEGLNVLFNLELTVSESMLGGNFKIPSVDGQKDVEIYVPALSQPDDLLKLTGKGLKSAVEDQVGDYLICLKVRWPKKLSDKQKALYQELRSTGA